MTVLLRPSALSLSSDSAAGGVLATVRRSSILGDIQRHQVAIGDLRLVVDQPADAGEELRPQMWLTVNTAGVHLLPEHPT